MNDVDDFLAHYGKKGMKWGVTTTDSGGSGGGKQQKKLSRKEVRALNKEGQRNFNINKINDIYSESKRGGERVLVETSFDGGRIRDIVTGKQFVDHIEKGGAVNAQFTEIFARQIEAGGQYVLNADRDHKYKPIKR